ncbi:MAG: glycerol-3-phosphate 1-O-acyltransferase PlsY [Rhodothermaceae bacterium]|nr:glycerol-3-phosphate 1-O-acyltransferase PlsY [Rhodothermaceae bacterium]
MYSLLLIVVISYCIGSIPGSLWVGKWIYKTDLRKHGSGNPGATNAYRVLGWKAGLLSTIIDMGKGYVAAGLVPGLVSALGIDSLPDAFIGLGIALLAGAAAVVGHMFPLWAKFKGGKGVNTAAGILIAITPLNMLIVFVIFCLVLWRTSYVSLASMTAASSYPISLILQKYVFGQNELQTGLIVFGVLLAAGIVLAHHSNIKRLLNGTENKITRKKSAGAVPKSVE